MSIINRISKYVLDPDFRFWVHCKLCLHNQMPDKDYLTKVYKFRLQRELHLDNPRSFNEKLQWLKIYDHNPAYTTMVDKYAVKDYVSSVIGEEYIIPTLGVWKNFDDIDFSKLPDQFVLKCTHDSGGLFICKAKKEFDIKKAKKKINHCLKRDYYSLMREWPYKNVPRRIIAEPYMNDGENEELQDYKFMCFNGKVLCSFICTERYSETGLHVTFFDR